MYRKNVANQYIYFALVSTSTGTGLTGASVTAYLALDNGAQATATGTTSELGNGQYRFNLSQADTNADEGSYLFIASGASPVEKTVVFTAANPSDGAAFGLSKFADIETDTQNIQSRIPAALVDGRIAANAQVVGDKTGYTAAVSDKTGFSLLAGTGLGAQNGSVALVTKVDELGVNALTANSAVDAIPTAVWNALLASYTTANTFGARIVRSANSNNTVQITGGGSNHIFAVLHDAEPNSIPEDAFVSGALSARALAVDAVGEIADGVWDEATSGHTTAGTTGKALIDSGAAGNPWSTDLATGYSGTQAGNILNEVKAKTDTITGNQTINVYPVSASTPERVAGTTITYYRNEIRSVSVVTDFTLTSLTLSFTIEDAEGTDLLTIANASITRSSQTFTVSIGTAATSSTGNKRWALRDITGGTNSVIARGVFSVQEAASA
jgi:hypothetical protein